MSEVFTQDVAGCFADAVGPGGLSTTAFARHLGIAGGALTRLRTARDARRLPFLTLPERRDDLDAMAGLAARYRDAFDDVLVLGTGGSALGGRALAEMAQPGPVPVTGAPRLHVLDNVDPARVDAVLAACAPARTGVLAISKSGGTVETLCQTGIVLDWLREALGEAALPGRATVMTEAADTPLGRVAGRFDLPVLGHDPDLGGRFSVLATGAVPAMLAGLDASALRAGAAEVTHAVLDAGEPAKAAAAVGAAIQVGLPAERGVAETVFMPYSDRLAGVARWFRQLWAESLGKDGGGTTPIDALGAVDQHSQLQLYLAGPANKLYTLVRVPAAGTGGRMPADLAADPGLTHLGGRTMGDLLDAEAAATAESLMQHGRPVRQFHVPRLDAYALGALLQHFMLETAVAADMLGVNAFDQPAVEDGKRRAKSYLTAMGSGGGVP